MAELVDANDIMFTPFEPKLKNRYIMQIDGIPAYMIRLRIDRLLHLKKLNFII